MVEGDRRHFYRFFLLPGQDWVLCFVRRSDGDRTNPDGVEIVRNGNLLV